MVRLISYHSALGGEGMLAVRGWAIDIIYISASLSPRQAQYDRSQNRIADNVPCQQVRCSFFLGGGGSGE